MRGFLLGLVLGGIGASAAFLLIGPPEVGKPSRVDPVGPSPSVPSAETVPPPPPPSSTTRPAPTPGQFELRAGEGFDFEEGTVRPGIDRPSMDLFCESVSKVGSTFSADAGGALALLPRARTGEAPAAFRVLFDALEDAPESITPGRLTLSVDPKSRTPGIALVRSRNGKAFKILLERVETDPSRRQWRAFLRYAEVPARSGGGSVHLAFQPAEAPADPAVREELAALPRKSPIPGEDYAGFGSFLDGAYTLMSGLPADLAMEEKVHISLQEPLRTGFSLEAGGGLYARGGIAEGGVVRYEDYSGVAVRGAMAGRIEGNSYGYIDISGDLTGEVLLESYAYLHVGGALSGKVTVDSYATVVVDGDITGTLTLRSYNTLLLRGRVFGTLDEERCSSGTFYINRFVPRSEVEIIEGAPGIILHVRESDLPVGENVGVAKWKGVVVGDPLWEKVPR